MSHTTQVGLNGGFWIEPGRIAAYYTVMGLDERIDAVVEVIEESPGVFVFGSQAGSVLTKCMIEANLSDIEDLPIIHVAEAFVDIVAGLEKDMCKAINEKRSMILAEPPPGWPV